MDVELIWTLNLLIQIIFAAGRKIPPFLGKKAYPVSLPLLLMFKRRFDEFAE